MKKEIILNDVLGQRLTVGCYVAASHRNGLYICRVVKITAKMARVVHIKDKSKDPGGWLKYPSETVMLSGEDALSYILAHG